MADVNIVIQANGSQAIREMKNAENGVKNLGAALKRNTGVSNQYGKVVDKNTRGLSTFAKSGLQQTGYQVGDFAVQVSGGTSALQAFGQQGSQLFGIFGAGGAIFGAAIAIFAGIANVYLKATAATNDLGKASDNLSDALTDANTKGKDIIGTYEGLRDEYDNITPSTIDFANAQRALNAALITQATINAKIALQNFNKEISAAYLLTNQMNASMTGSLKDFDKFSAKVKSLYYDDLASLAKNLGITDTAVRKLGFALGDLSNAETPEETLNAVNAALNAISSGTVAITDDQKELVTILNNLGMVARTTATDFVELTLAEVEAAREAVRAFDETKTLSKGIASSFGDSFKSIITGTESVKDAFKNMARSIISQLFDVLVIQRLVGTVGTGGANSGGTGLAGIFSGTGKAIGGPVQSGSAYMVGERGPEMFIPSASGAIVPNNKMGGGSGVTVNQTINISTGVAQTVRSEVAQLLPQIQDAAKSAVLDARKRGGSFSTAFGA